MIAIIQTEIIDGESTTYTVDIGSTGAEAEQGILFDSNTPPVRLLDSSDKLAARKCCESMAKALKDAGVHVRVYFFIDEDY